MTYRPNLSRMARLAAGSRPPAPGQDPLREEELRIELTQEFGPENLVEKIWVEDIAYRVASIEVIRAQIAGFRSGVVKTAHRELVSAEGTSEFLRQCAGKDENLFALDDKPDEVVWSAQDRKDLADRAADGFVAPDRGTLLDRFSFAQLLGAMGQEDLARLRQLQVYEHEEVRERDRIVNQFERRRRQAMRHAIEMVEVRRRAGLADGAADPVPDGAGEVALPLANDDSGEPVTMAGSPEDAAEAGIDQDDGSIASLAAGEDEDEPA